MRRGLVAGSFSLLAAAVIVAVPAATLSSAQSAGSGTRAIPAGGTTSIRGSAQGPDGLQQPELRPGGGEDEPGAFNRPRPGFKNGKFPKKPLDAAKVASSLIAASNADLLTTANGLTHRDQRLANGGNQFSLEPPDQALCVGNGFVVEAVNSVLRVWSAANGAALTGVQDLNTFFGYPAAIDRTTGVIGPDVIDPVCHYDPDNQRFIVVITTLHVDAERRLQRQEHDRPGRLQHRRPDGHLDHLPRAGAERRHRRHARTTAARSTATRPARASRTTRTSVATPTASTSRPTSTTCSGRASTPRRSSPSPRRSSPPTRHRST